MSANAGWRSPAIDLHERADLADRDLPTRVATRLDCPKGRYAAHRTAPHRTARLAYRAAVPCNRLPIARSQRGRPHHLGIVDLRLEGRVQHRLELWDRGRSNSNGDVPMGVARVREDRVRYTEISCSEPRLENAGTSRLSLQPASRHAASAIGPDATTWLRASCATVRAYSPARRSSRRRGRDGSRRSRDAPPNPRGETTA